MRRGHVTESDHKLGHPAFRDEPNQSHAIYKIYIDYIRHENDLMHQRTTWFLAIQSLLFASFGYLILTYFESSASYIFLSPDVPVPKIVELYIESLTICTFGMVSTKSAEKSIKAARLAQNSLVDKWELIRNSTLHQDTLADTFPRLMGGNSKDAEDDGGHFAESIVGISKLTWHISFLCLFTTSIVTTLLIIKSPGEYRTIKSKGYYCTITSTMPITTKCRASP